MPLQFDLPVEPFAVGLEDFTPLGPAHVDALLTNTGAGIVGSGEISIDLEVACSRCLRLFPLHVDGTIEGFYVLPDRASSLPEDQDYELIEARSLDIGPSLVAAIVIALPMAPLHDEECKGICAHCGTDLNESTCSCVNERADSPFSALEGLLDKD